MDREMLGRMRTKLTTLEKMQAAEELVDMTTVIDEEHGVVLWSHIHEYIEKALQVKWYFGMDISDYLAEGKEGIARLCDELKEDEEFGRALKNTDWLDVSVMADELFLNVREVFEKEHSLEHAIRTSFGFLFDGKDLTQSMSEARDVTEQMINQFGKIMKAEDVLAGKRLVNLGQYAKKKKIDKE